MSRFAENGSHPEATDAAEGLAGQVEGLGSSRNAGTGSHLEATGPQRAMQDRWTVQVAAETPE